jgi:hypothetical protein
LLLIQEAPQLIDQKIDERRSFQQGFQGARWAWAAVTHCFGKKRVATLASAVVRPIDRARIDTNLVG